MERTGKSYNVRGRHAGADRNVPSGLMFMSRASCAYGIAACVLLAVRISADTLDFQKQVRPILSDNCYQCHGPDEKSRVSELRLDQRDGALADLGGTFAIVPGKPDESELYRRIATSDPDLHMPPANSARHLSDEQISILRRWIETGAEWKDHWAFVPPVLPPVPEVAANALSRHPIDSFVRARWIQEGLSPSAEAAPETLVRRATLDLTGLPPTIHDVDAYLADSTPDRFDRLVDRLLASPRYGEHKAAAWLDAARYSDTNGYQNDGTRTMWPWRDWLIGALNANMPFDQFTIEQTAGDLLANPTDSQVMATGFHRNHMLNGEGGRIPEESRVEYVFDRVETLGTVWLGLTIGCARCHDHKYDPIAQKDYYRLYAYFNSIDEGGGVDRGGNANPVIPAPTPEQQEARERLLAEIRRLEEKIAAWTPANTDPSLAGTLRGLGDAVSHRLPLERELRAARRTLAKLEASFPETMVLRDRSEPRPTHLLVRGAYDKPETSETLDPGLPSILPQPDDLPKSRLGLAQWLVYPGNPLTSRVAVNRIWQGYFGAGLVRTPEDFGSQGEPPTHPDLLDWLAVEFRNTGWDVKRLDRQIVTSATYRQSSAMRADLLDRDPENRLLARGPRYRLTSLALRDQALAIAGLLGDAMGGPGVHPYQPEDVWTDFSLGKLQYKRDQGASLYRRSLYVFWRRSVGPTMFFDTANRQVCSVRTRLTNTPLHALTLWNDPTYVEAARVLAERVLDAGEAPQERLRWAFRSATAREPTPQELEVLRGSLQRSLSRFGSKSESANALLKVGDQPASAACDPIELAAYTAVMNVILNLDEVQTKE